jgi:hypothetical protein
MPLLTLRGYSVSGMCVYSQKIEFRFYNFYNYLSNLFLHYPNVHTYIHTYHSRFIPEGVAEVSQIFLRDIHVLPKLVSYEEHCRQMYKCINC